MTAGLVVLVVVLAAAGSFGLLRKRRDGVMRETARATAARRAAPPPGASQPSDLSQPSDPTPPSDPAQPGPAGSDALASADLGAELGERATLLQFSSAFCAPCRTTRVVLADVAARVPGVAHVEVDAESHLDLVRRLGVLRTPTVLVLDRHGREVRRATGAPRKDAVLAALAEAV